MSTISEIIKKVATGTFVAFFVAAQLSHAQITVVHSQGETSVPKHPERVVILENGSLETYYSLGIPVIGGPDNVPAYLSDFQKKNPGYSGVGSVARANLSAIAALKPDLIIIGGRLRSVYDSLSAIAPTVTFGTSTDDLWGSFEKNVNTLAALYGKERLAGKKLRALRKKVDKVKEKSRQDAGKSLFVLHVNERFIPNGPKSRFGFGYDILGLNPAYTAPPGSGNRRIGSDGPTQMEIPPLTQINPDYLFIIDRATGIKGTMPNKQDLLTEDVKATNAYKNDKVFILPGNIWYLSGGGLRSVEKQITDIGRQLYGLTFR